MLELDTPTTLPVANLSLSSVSLFLRCPEKFRRRYIDNEYEGPTSPAMILGSAVGAAEARAYQQQIDTGTRLPTDDVLDAYAQEFDYRLESEEVDWSSSEPGEIKDTGVAAIKAYDRTIAPSVVAVSVERRFELQLEGVEWGFTGYFDVEDNANGLRDLKVRKAKMSQTDADTDLQPTSYFLARRAEGNPASGFAFDTMVKTKTPYAEIVPTTRSDAQLDAFTHRLYGVAAEIGWRVQTGNWAGAAPGHWICSEKMCGYWHRCPMGGALRVG